MLDIAISIAAAAFIGKFDKGDQPYILHCLHVMNKMPPKDTDARIIAVLHDLLEDCPEWTPTLLLQEGFTIDQVNAIIVLTHAPEVSYDMYIKQIHTAHYCNFAAKRVKREDIRHNSDITRLKGVRAKDFARIEKYHKAYVYLSD